MLRFEQHKTEPHVTGVFIGPDIIAEIRADKFVWFSSRTGLTAAELRTIADELDRLNRAEEGK